MQAGELIVTGKDKAVIPLHGLPRKVNCHFKHGCDVVPCNPQHEDCLEYEIQSNHCHHDDDHDDCDHGHHNDRGHHHHHHHDFVLVIKWHVSGVREIVWTVHY